MYSRPDIQFLANYKDPSREDQNKLIDRALEGDPISQYQMGILLSNEDKNELAVKCYQAAADKGYLLGQYAFANCLEMGRGVEKDEKAAAEWYRKSAESGFDRGQAKFGRCLALGKGVEKDEKAAAEWFRRSAEQRNSSGQNNFGICLELGKGVEKDEKAAAEWFRRSAEQGNSCGQYNFGRCLEQGIGFEKNIEQAWAWYRKSADQNFPDALSQLGYHLLLAKKEEEANIQFQKVAGKNVIADFFLEHKITVNSKKILYASVDSLESYSPTHFPDLVSQNGNYCGSAALAGAGKYAQAKNLYASQYEKKTDPNSKECSVVVLDELQKTNYPSPEGPQFNINSFTEVADKVGLEGCKPILKDSYSEEEYKEALLNALRTHHAIVVACEVDNFMPAEKKGHNTHWALVFGYYKKENDYILEVTHYGVYCQWNLHDLYQSNKQIPDENPLSRGGGSLKQFRNTFFKVPRKGPEPQLIIDGSVNFVNFHEEGKTERIYLKPAHHS